LVPGIDYKLTATTSDRKGKALGLAKVQFNISGREAETGVVNLGQLVVTGSRSIAGRIRVASDALNAVQCPSHVLLTFDINAPALMGETLSTNPDSFCHFVFSTLFSHEYRLRILGLPPGLYVKGATCGQHNVLEEEWLPDCDSIDVEVKSGGASVSATVVDADGKTVSDAEAILVSSTDARKMMAQPVNTDGKVRFSSMPPGSYRLVAVSGISDDDASNPDIANKYSIYSSVLTLQPQENRGVSLTAIKAE
jgi:hypothetical protein